ncbi:putative Clavaminate synthase-like protein [Seiridium unicorne]|uniref:Clavaminate synthase-like protein n=1 Tax=Seiridium unicorne TaxID=138068 RepID=A0ABR2UQT5_9PEZI
MGNLHTAPSFQIPLVNIAPYLEDPTSAAASNVVDQVRQACRSTGFFQILGHGVPRDIQRYAFDASKRFFNLPVETKLKYKASLESGWKGYETLAAQSYKSDMLGDLKEGFILSTDLPEGHPLRGAPGRFLTSLNRWPENELAEDDFRKPVEAYCHALSKICNAVVDLIAETLPYGSSVFEEMKVDAACPLRLLHYPTVPPGKNTSKQNGASAHTDFSAITLLLQDEQPGLEVFDPTSEEWHVVPPNANAYVVNLGDMITKMVGSEYKSGLHRVINKSPKDRYSIVYFFDGKREFKLRPLNQDGLATEQSEKILTCEEFMFNRIRSSFGKHAKHDMSTSSGH